MNKNVFKKTYTAPDIDICEIRRYLGIGKNDQSFDSLITDCLSEIAPLLRYSVCFKLSHISLCDSNILFDNIKINSMHLSKNLSDCDKMIIFSSTIGIEPDRRIKKYMNITPLRSLCIQAICTERIEALCDKFTEDIPNLYGISLSRLKPRFSPGYGDLALQHQRDIFSILEISKNIGVNLTESLLMVPSKSVTAFIGVKIL